MKITPTMFTNVKSIGNLLSAVLYLIFLVYIRNLERKSCNINQSWKKEVVKYVSMILLVISIFEILPGVSLIECISKSKITGIVYTVCSLAYIVIMLLFVRDLKKEREDCSENWKRNLMEVYVWLVIALVVISIISSFAFAKNFKANIKF